MQIEVRPHRVPSHEKHGHDGERLADYLHASAEERPGHSAEGPLRQAARRPSGLQGWVLLARTVDRVAEAF